MNIKNGFLVQNLLDLCKQFNQLKNFEFFKYK